MNFILYYIDKVTAWLDFSWLINRDKKYNSSKINNNDLYYDHDPLLLA
jgi:hypothetical protein